MESKIDRRIRKTKKALFDSLLQLLEKQPINKVSVSDLCALADVNRSSFYKYYSDPFDMLEQIERNFFEDFSTTWNVYIAQHSFSEIVLVFVNKIFESQNFCRILFNPHRNTQLLEQLLQVAYSTCITDFKKRNPDADNSQLEYLYAFLVHGSLGIIKQWLNNNCEESPDIIADLIKQISTHGMQCYNLGYSDLY